MTSQRHFRFRTDTGAADATPTWGANEDSNTFTPGTSPFRLRFSIENPTHVATGSLPYEIYLSKNGGAYAAITTSSTNGLKSADAGSDADNTSIFIPRLTTPVWTPLAGATIDLDFANGQVYPSGAFTDYLSCSRASNGYSENADGTLTQFSSNALRITDLGLLVEDARTNLVLQSDAFSNSSYWLATVLGVAADAANAPDGTATADKLTVTGSDSERIQGAEVGANVFTCTSGTVYSISIFAKAGSGATWCNLLLGDFATSFVRVWFNLSGGGTVGSNSVIGNGVLDSASIEAKANGWYRLAIRCHFTATLSLCRLAFYPCEGGDGLTTTTNADFQYVWGAQAEEASFPSSYIPTTTASATRAADAVLIGGSLSTVLKAELGATASVFVDIISHVSPPSGEIIAENSLDYTLFETDGTNNNKVQSLNAFGTIDATFGSGNFSTGGKLGHTYDANGRSLVANAGTVVSDTHRWVPLGDLYLGSVGATNFWSGYIRRIAAWDSRLSDTIIQSLTVP